MQFGFYDTILELTAPDVGGTDRAFLVNSFASSFGWHPSDRFETPDSMIARDHLLIEHGLENAAVISFLNRSRRYSNLSFVEIHDLLKISYNNLVDWHVTIEPEYVTFLYNRTYPVSIIDKLEISRSNLDSVRYEAFERVVGKKPNPNLPALDNAFIDTISYWKRNLSAELGYETSNESFSSLFNALIFLRAVEDTFRREQLLQNDVSGNLLAKLQGSENITPHALITESFRSLTGEDFPTFLIDLSQIRIFNDLSKGILKGLITDLYRNRFAPYEYDFSLMSKHALSRIYEHYVSRLRIQETEQLTLFPQLPEEEKVKAYGGVYTPQFIAKFFAKFLKKEVQYGQFGQIKIVDPACGSGIFLRTILEMQLESLKFNDDAGITSQIPFENISGIDIDVNACNATKLSLSLLHLVANGVLPERLDIQCYEAIEYYSVNTQLRGSYDVVIANPPFISLDTQALGMRERLVEFLGDLAKGRADVSLAFLKIAMDLLKPGGFGLFVLPHSFLIGSAASSIRQFLAKDAWIRILADLSTITVFENAGAYVVLLIFQKKLPGVRPPAAKILRCRDMVGKALEDALKNINIETKYYSIYETDQAAFQDKDWLLLPPAEEVVKRKLKGFSQLKDLFVTRQGFISGADEIFIVSKEQIPKGEQKIYVPYLHDRNMSAYLTPRTTSRYFFYPYIDGRKIEEKELEERFPKTWAYLLSHYNKLSERKSLKKYNKQWWEPLWPRLPENMMRPKIVTPHLVLFPKFSIDLEGKYAVSHSPLLYLKDAIDEANTLKVYTAILNSRICNWYISSHSHKYQRGYLVLEPATLASVPIPLPSDISAGHRLRLLNLVERRLGEDKNINEIDREIDFLVLEIYGISEGEIKDLGMEI